MYRRVHEPEALDPRSAVWAGGRFDAGRRPLTASVEGVTRTHHHLVLMTLKGGARRLTVRADDGHRYDGPDRAGAVSFLPAGAERRIALVDVEAEWASVALAPEAVDGSDALARLAPFSNEADPFLAVILGELDRAHRQDGAIDAAYGETMGLAIGRYLARRAGAPPKAAPRPALPGWKLARVEEFIAANLGRPIAIAELAAVAGLSAGHFHRAFREATGATPLQRLQERRIERAVDLLRSGARSSLDVAAAVGFDSPSHFARLFRRHTGRRPSEARGR